MSPIRVALVGLGPTLSSYYVRGQWGVQHLNAITASPYYELVAVCNSSAESAQRSIAAHKLDSNKVKAYGSTADVAADPDVDLVVIAVETESHVQLAKPILQAGKDIYIEYPIANNATEVQEMADLADAHGSRTIAGMQATTNHAVRKMKEIVASGDIGHVVSSHMSIAAFSFVQGWPATSSNALHLRRGDNRIAVGTGNPLAAFVDVLGTFKDVQSIYKLDLKKATLLGADGKPVEEAEVTAPDVIALQGILESGAVGSVDSRATNSPADGTGFRWNITGRKGEIVLSAGAGAFQTGPPDMKIHKKLWDEKESTEVDWSVDEPKHVSNHENFFTPSVARHYEAFAKGGVGSYPSLRDSIKLHELMDRATSNAVWAS